MLDRFLAWLKPKRRKERRTLENMLEVSQREQSERAMDLENRANDVMREAAIRGHRIVPHER